MLSVLRVSEVRARIDTALTDAGYTRSRFVPEHFGRDTDHIASGCYSISAPNTETQQFDERDRFPLPDEGEARSRFDVRTAYRLRPDAMDIDYNKALDHEHEVMKAVLTADPTYLSVKAHGTPTRASSPAGDWLISTLHFTVWHRIAFI